MGRVCVGCGQRQGGGGYRFALPRGAAGVGVDLAVGILDRITQCGDAELSPGLGDTGGQQRRVACIGATQGTTLEEAQAVLGRHRIEKLPVVDADGRLSGLITVKDIQKRIQYPDATKDAQGRLRVGAAVGTGPRFAKLSRKLARWSGREEALSARCWASSSVACSEEKVMISTSRFITSGVGLR